MNYREALARFKLEEKDAPESVVPLMDDVELRTAVAVWKSVPVVMTADDEEAPEDVSDREVWDWLWSKTVVDRKVFTSLSGVKVQGGSALLERVIGLRLVYPDGTVNALARQFLQAMIMSKIPKGRVR